MTDGKTVLVSIAIILGGIGIAIGFSCLAVAISSPEDFWNKWRTSATQTAKSELEYEMLREGFLPAEVEQCFVWALGPDWQVLEISATPDRWRALHPDEPVICGADDIRRGNAIIIGAWKRHKNNKKDSCGPKEN